MERGFDEKLTFKDKNFLLLYAVGGGMTFS